VLYQSRQAQEAAVTAGLQQIYLWGAESQIQPYSKTDDKKTPALAGSDLVLVKLESFAVMAWYYTVV